jgi:hypothetical protein
MALAELTLANVVLGAIGFIILTAGWLLRPFIRNLFTTSLRSLPGPKRDSWFSGNLIRIFQADPGGSSIQSTSVTLR